MGTSIDVSAVGSSLNAAAARGATRAGQTSSVDGEPKTKSDGKGFANLAFQVAIYSGIGKQALDGARLLPKLKESWRAREFIEGGGHTKLGPLTLNHKAGRLPTAIRQLVTMQPSTTIIDPTAPDLKKLAPELHAAALAKSAGRTFSSLDRSAYITSTLLGAGLAVVTLSSGLPNLASGVIQDGPSGLVQTEEGRAGLIQVSGGGLALWLLAKGMQDVHPDIKAQQFTRAASRTSRAMLGAEATMMDKMPAAVRSVYNGVHHITAGARAPRNALPWTAGAGLASAALLWVNHWGYLDAMNSDDDRSIGTKLKDAVNETPLLNRLV